IGKKDYKGTILDRRGSFDSWRIDLDDSLLSDDLMLCYYWGNCTNIGFINSRRQERGRHQKHLPRTDGDTTEYRPNPQELGKPRY
ncbi:hypothetical protein BKA61DRAFT_622791, partial [Leptodontidium sp. MPI-SDFR-AT-0119]